MRSLSAIKISVITKLNGYSAKAKIKARELREYLENSYLMARSMNGNWTKELKDLPSFILGFALSIGIALVILGNFASGLGVGTPQNTVNNVIGYFNQALSTFGYIIVLLVFVVGMYALLKDKKLI